MSGGGGVDRNERGYKETVKKGGKVERTKREKEKHEIWFR